MIENSRKQVLIEAYQQSWKLTAEKIEKSISEIQWDSIVGLVTAKSEIARLYEYQEVDLIKNAKEALTPLGITSFTGDLDFIIETEEFKLCNQQTNFLRDAETLILERGVNALKASGKAALLTMKDDAPIEEFAKFSFHSIGVEFNIIGTEYIEKFIKKVNEKNADGLRGFLSVKENTVSTAIFERLTGVKLPKTSRDTLIKLDEWAGISPKQRLAKDREKQADNLKAEQTTLLKRSWKTLSETKVEHKGQLITMNSLIHALFEEGFTSINKSKVGAITRYGMMDMNHKAVFIKDKEFNSFLKLAQAFGGIENTLEFLNPVITKADTKKMK